MEREKERKREREGEVSSGGTAHTREQLHLINKHIGGT